MSGFSQFYNSERLSDTKLVLVYSASRSSAGEGTSCPILSDVATVSNADNLPASGSLVPGTPPISKASSRKKATIDPPSNNKKRKADMAEADIAKDVEIHIAAHKVVLISMSQYFSIRFETAVGESPSTALKVYAETLDELFAMEAVVGCIYANNDKLPEYCSADTVAARESQTSPMSHLHRLLSVLTVADRWQVRSCLASCTRAICGLPPTSLTWEDCHFVFDLPESLTRQPEVSGISKFAYMLATRLAITASTIPPFMPTEVLRTHLDPLPVSVRRGMLACNKLGFIAVRCIVSSEEQVAESEDDLAVMLHLYLCSTVGMSCTGPERMELKDLLRCQHMSNTFVGLRLPHLMFLQFGTNLWPQLMYLRGLKGLASIPPTHRLTAVPEAWYKSPRRQARPLPHTINLTLNLSESNLVKQLAAAALLKSNGTVPPTFAGTSVLHSTAVDLRGVSWCMHLGPSAEAFQVYITPTLCVDPRSRDSVASEKAGLHAEVVFRIHSLTSPLAVTVATWWAPPGLGILNLAHARVPLGNPNDILWWKDYIIDGNVRLSAIVKLL